MNDPKFIVDGIRTMVIPMMTQLMDKYPIFEKFYKEINKPPEDFDFYMSTAGLGYALSLVDDEEAKKILKEANLLDRNYQPVINNLFGFVQKQEQGVGFNNIIGIWVLWNFKGEMPASEELKEVASAIGILLEGVARDLCNIYT